MRKKIEKNNSNVDADYKEEDINNLMRRRREVLFSRIQFHSSSHLSIYLYTPLLPLLALYLEVYPLSGHSLCISDSSFYDESYQLPTYSYLYLSQKALKCHLRIAID